MINLIKHLLTTNIDNIVKNSYLNSYADGVHTIVLSSNENFSISLMIAEDNSQLHDKTWTTPIRMSSREKTMHIVQGVLIHNIYQQVPKKSRGCIEIAQYNRPETIYGMVKPENFLIQKSHLQYFPDYSVSVHPEAFYNLHCRRGQTSWLVYESKLNPHYKSMCFSFYNPDTDLTKEKSIQKPSKQKVLELLCSVFPNIQYHNI